MTYDPPRLADIEAARRDPRLHAARAADPNTQWHDRARCRTVDPETFFPLRNDDDEPAVAVCRLCDVQPECLAAALRLPARDGIWAGTTPKERAAMHVANRQLDNQAKRAAR